MKNRWFMISLIILTIASLLLAACGGTQTTTAPQEQAQEEAAPSQAEPEEEAEVEAVEEAEPAAETGPEPVTISLARFFGDCDDTTDGVTDVSQATTECEVIQKLF